jgi:transposase-like protein
LRTTIVQAARKHHVSETSISNWRRQFIEGWCVGLSPGRSAESSHPVGISRRTYFRRQSRLKSGELTAEGPWPSPAVDAAAKLLEDYLAEHEGLGHRRLHALMAADGHVTTESTVLRAMRRLDGDEPAAADRLVYNQRQCRVDPARVPPAG